MLTSWELCKRPASALNPVTPSIKGKLSPARTDGKAWASLGILVKTEFKWCCIPTSPPAEVPSGEAFSPQTAGLQCRSQAACDCFMLLAVRATKDVNFNTQKSCEGTSVRLKLPLPAGRVM